MNKEQHLCDYGCGQPAIKQFKNGKWCCSKKWTKCLGYLRKLSESHIGQKAWNKGLNNIYSEETKSKMGNPKFGIDNPFYGKKHSEEAKKIMSEKKKGKSSHMLGKKHSKETRMKISIANASKIYKISSKITIECYKNRYPTFAKIEEMRYNPNKPGEKEIQVHCKNHLCKNSKEHGGWFTPEYYSFYERIRNIENEKGTGAGYLYCCEECKDECPLYGIRTTQIIKADKQRAGRIEEELYTSEEYNTWRKEVFNRNGYYCEYCDEKGTHIHHIQPQKLEPGFVLDPDFGVVCCRECHYKYGHKTRTECSTGNLANKICI